MLEEIILGDGEISRKDIDIEFFGLNTWIAQGDHLRSTIGFEDVEANTLQWVLVMSFGQFEC